MKSIKHKWLQSLMTLALILGMMAGVKGQAEEMNHSQPSVYFTENKGQVHDGKYNPNPDVLFMGITPIQQLVISGKGVSHQLKSVIRKEKEDCNSDGMVQHFRESETEIDKMKFCRVDMEWLNANAKPQIERSIPLPGYINYYNLPFASEGIMEVRDYTEVRLKGIYKGIDVRYYSNGNVIEYDYEIAPGADYHQIKVKISGTKGVLNSQGQLELKTSLGTIVESAPRVVQNSKVLNSRWIQLGKDVWSFEIQGYNPSLAMVIDPVVRVWGTYYGGSMRDIGRSCKGDANGNVYLVGSTTSNNNIATMGSYSEMISGASDAFLIKFDGNGTRQWGAYYGGDTTEEGSACAIDGNGNVYLAGSTNSYTGIATAGSIQDTLGGNGFFDAFLVKFNSNGVRKWCTYLGGRDYDYGNYCEVDGDGNIFVSGATRSSSGIATNNSFQDLYKGIDIYFNAFLVKFDGNGSRLWGTYYGGGSGNTNGLSVAIDLNKNVYMAGTTRSGTLISSSGVHQETAINTGDTPDAFLVKFNSNGDRQWGTYYGGTEWDYGYSCAVDNTGNVFLTGQTNSYSNISTPGAYNNNGGGLEEKPRAFLVKFNASGVRQWGTYYGGNFTYGNACSTDNIGNVYLAGSTSASEWMATAGSPQDTFGGYTDAFLVKFNTNGARQWATYIGGKKQEKGYSCFADATGSIYVTGETESVNGIAIHAHQNVYGGNINDAFLLKFTDGISDVKEEIDSEILIYPNPATSALSISTNELNVETLSIYSLAGEKLSEQTYSEQIDISALAKGVYFLELKSEGAVGRKRFVKM